MWDAYNWREVYYGKTAWEMTWEQAQCISFASSRCKNEILRARFFHPQLQYLISFLTSTERHIFRIWPRIIVANKSNLPVFLHVFDAWHWSTNGAEMIEHSIYIPSRSNFAFEHTIFLNTRVTLCEIFRSLVDLFCQE